MHRPSPNAWAWISRSAQTSLSTWAKGGGGMGGIGVL